MGLDNGFVVKDVRNDIFIFESHYRKDWALREIVLNILEPNKKDESIFYVNPNNMRDILYVLKKIQEGGKKAFENETQEELCWVYEDRLDECEQISNRYEKAAAIDEIYKQWATDIIVSITDILAAFYDTVLFRKEESEFIAIYFYDSY